MFLCINCKWNEKSTKSTKFLFFYCLNEKDVEMICGVVWKRMHKNHTTEWEWMTRQFFRYSYTLPYRLFAIELDGVNDAKGLRIRQMDLSYIPIHTHAHLNRNKLLYNTQLVWYTMKIFTGCMLTAAMWNGLFTILFCYAFLRCWRC